MKRYCTVNEKLKCIAGIANEADVLQICGVLSGEDTEKPLIRVFRTIKELLFYYYEKRCCVIYFVSDDSVVGVFTI